MEEGSHTSQIGPQSKQQKSSGPTFALSAIIGAIWIGVFGFIAASAKSLSSDQLFTLIQEGLIIGTILTVAAMILGSFWLKRNKGGGFKDMARKLGLKKSTQLVNPWKALRYS